VRVAITDATIFTADNPDRFPPDLDTLVKGVNVLPISAGNMGPARQHEFYGDRSGDRGFAAAQDQGLFAEDSRRSNNRQS